MLSGFETAYGAQLIGCTIARVRLDLTVLTPTAPGGLLYGVRVADVDQATDLAVAPTYGPGSRPHLDWMAWGTVLTESSSARAVKEVDVRSMRKVEELGETLVLSVENAGVDSITWGGAISVLVMLP